MYAILIILMCAVLSTMMLTKNVERPQKEMTHEEIAKATEIKRIKEDNERFEKQQQQINDLIQIVTAQQEVSVGTPDDLDATIEHICDRCPAVSMGKFNTEEQEKFEDIKDKYPPKKGSRPMKSLSQVRGLFLDSIICTAPECPFTKEVGETFIDEYVKIRRNVEARTQIWMAKHKITQYPPMMGKN